MCRLNSPATIRGPETPAANQARIQPSRNGNETAPGTEPPEDGSKTLDPRAGIAIGATTGQSSLKRYSRSSLVRFVAKPSSPSTSWMVWDFRCCSSQIFSSTVPGAIRR